ncbi:Lipopolysaccharide assembly protein A [Buchnera aphidicola (Neophyllaphis podocarpi)]|uniref:LapA family protein n=1 Tax=Buchnera aphidicola TaxID=9 RepID=UPI0034642233
MKNLLVILFILFIIVICSVIFAYNNQIITLNLVFYKIKYNLSKLIILTFVIGFIIGFLITYLFAILKKIF